MVVPSTQADAGGWAVGSLDGVPAPVAGEVVDVGFTILQHGATPAVLDADVGIQVDSPDGSTYFAAQPSGDPGHYVASVSFPERGEFEWRLMMGWFGPQDLGIVTVSEPPRATTSWLPWARWSAIAVAGALIGHALLPLISSRRRRVATS